MEWPHPPLTTTLLIFGTKCEGKFVPDDRTFHVATEHVQCTGLGWWESWETDWQLTTVSANKRQAKILKVCVNQWHEICTIVPFGGQHWVTDFKKCEQRPEIEAGANTMMYFTAASTSQHKSRLLDLSLPPHQLCISDSSWSLGHPQFRHSSQF